MMNFAILALAGAVSAKYLATTTRYYDNQEGACGCGNTSGIFSWQLGISTDVYTAAGSQALFDTNAATWCGGGCGKCYNLTSTGGTACSSCGSGATAGTSIIVMVTNLCPNSGNEQWCPSVNGVNNYGYSYHFDIMAQSQVFGDNAVVEFEPVTCPGAATTDFEQCVCYGQLETDETPVGLTSNGTSSSSSSSSAAAVSSSSAASTHINSASVSTATTHSSASTITPTTFAVSTTVSHSVVSSAVTSKISQTSATAVVTTSKALTATSLKKTSSAGITTSTALTATSIKKTSAATTAALSATSNQVCVATTRTTTVYVD